MPPIDLVRHCFIEPFGEGSSRTLSDLTPTTRVLEAILRRTLLLRMGYREGLTRIQLWLLNSLMQQTVLGSPSIRDGGYYCRGVQGSQAAAICSLDYIPDPQGSYCEAT